MQLATQRAHQTEEAKGLDRQLSRKALLKQVPRLLEALIPPDDLSRLQCKA